MCAIKGGNPNIIQLLLNEGAALHTQTGDGIVLNTLTCACHYSQIGAVQILLSYGADPNIQDHFEEIPLMLACAKQLTPAVELFPSPWC